DGIRDRTVTGVQTCALPILFSISPRSLLASYSARFPGEWVHLRTADRRAGCTWAPRCALAECAYKGEGRPTARAFLARFAADSRSEEHTSELQSPYDRVCRL